MAPAKNMFEKWAASQIWKNVISLFRESNLAKGLRRCDGRVKSLEVNFPLCSTIHFSFSEKFDHEVF